MVTEPLVPTRKGDGSFACLTRSQIRADLEEGSAAAVRRAKVPPLTDQEIVERFERCTAMEVPK